tara:strand:- start:1427 stop:2032 length:606 start_codon:yes stop_codon:yes gene_type:complete
MKDSKLAEGGLGKKRDIRLAKRFIKDLQGIDTPAAKEFKALMNEVLAGGYKPVKKKDGGIMDIGKTKKKTKKKDPFRADKTTSLNREFSKRTARANREAMKNVKKKAKGGSLKPLPSAGENPGLRKLPTEVRNKMGYMKKGGKVTSNQSKITKVRDGLRKAVKAHTGQAKMLSSIKLNKGGKIVKMRGGGAATRGMNFKVM